MDAINILKSLEDAIAEVAMWPWAMVRTFWRILTRPSWAQEHVLAESRKGPEDRDITYMRPMLFWLLWVAAPHFLVVQSLLNIAQDNHPWLQRINAMPWTLNLFLVAFLLVSWPFTFAKRIYIRLQHPEPKELRRLLATQCLIAVPTQLAWLLYIVPMMFEMRSKAYSNLMGIVALATLVHWMFLQVTTCRRELGDWGEASSVILPGLGLWVLAVMLLIGVYAILAVLSGIAPV